MGFRKYACYHSLVERKSFHLMDDSSRNCKLVLRLVLRNLEVSEDVISSSEAFGNAIPGTQDQLFR